MVSDKSCWLFVRVMLGVREVLRTPNLVELGPGEVVAFCIILAGHSRMQERTQHLVLEHYGKTSVSAL